MKKIHKKTVLLSVLAIVAAILLIVICLFWPVIRSAASVRYLEDGLYSMKYGGDYGLDSFLEQGGGTSDMAVADYVIGRLFHGLVSLNLQGRPFGCSTLSVSNSDLIRLLPPQNGASCLTRAAARPNITTGKIMRRSIPFG